MHFSLSVLLLSFAFFAHAKDKEKDYLCDFTWKTLSENSQSKKVMLHKSLKQNITETISVSMEINGLNSSLTLKEIYKDNKNNFNVYHFSCNIYLSCDGNSIKMFNGKKENEKLIIEPTSLYSLGKSGERELFQYRNISNGFAYDYIIYRSERNEPMGLKVVCKK